MATKTEKQDALARLHEWIKPGDTVYTVLDHVSASGMSRAIRVILLHADCETGAGRVVDLHPNHAVGVVLGLRHWRRNGRQQDALVMGGCGMDMGYELVYRLSRTLFGEGFDCIGKGCPSNDHTNGDRVYTPHKHSDPGYALRQRWL